MTNFPQISLFRFIKFNVPINFILDHSKRKTVRTIIKKNSFVLLVRWKRVESSRSEACWAPIVSGNERDNAETKREDELAC